MTGEYFKARVRAAGHETGRRQLEIYQVDVPVRVIGPGGRYLPSASFVWDTGAVTSVVSEAVARAAGFDLDQADRTRVTGVTGAADAWLVPRFVTFPDLPGVRFRVFFLVPEGSSFETPLLGMRDVYRNFDVSTRGKWVYFFLKSSHTGEPVPAG